MSNKVGPITLSLYPVPPLYLLLLYSTITMTNNSTILYPPVADRLKAGFADGIFVFILSFFFTYLFSLFDEVDIKVKALAFAFTFLLYEPLMVSFLGGTIGHRMFDIRVKREKRTDKNLNLFAALIRSAVKLILGMISFAFAWFDSKQQTLHDHFSGSIVVYPTKKTPANPIQE